MTLKLYKNYSDKNVLDKNITQIGNDITGTLRTDCSIIDPVIAIENLTDLGVNYAYITEYGRYFYINNIILKGNLYELHMHVDVLKTYEDQIRNIEGVISRQEYRYNLYIQDGVFKTYSQPNIQISQFPAGFTAQEFIFSVAG